MAIEQNKNAGKGESEEVAGKSSTEPGSVPIVVHSHAGFKRDERPRAFELQGKRLTILSVKKTWHNEPAEGGHRKTIFRVHAHDGRNYDIALDGVTGEWTLEPFGRDRA